MGAKKIAKKNTKPEIEKPVVEKPKEVTTKEVTAKEVTTQDKSYAGLVIALILVIALVSAGAFVILNKDNNKNNPTPTMITFLIMTASSC